MQVVLKGVLLGASLILLSISLLGKGILAGEEDWWRQPEVSALRESETSDLREVEPKIVANDPGGDLQGPSPHQHLAEEEKSQSSLPSSSSQAWSNKGPEEPVCRVKLDRTGDQAPNHLEVVGLLTSHESGFLKALSRSTWSDGDLEEFGLCPPDVPHSLLSSLQRISSYLADPGDRRFLLLHLEEGRCQDQKRKVFLTEL